MVIEQLLHKARVKYANKASDWLSASPAYSLAAQISMTKEDRANLTFNPDYIITLKQLNAEAPQVRLTNLSSILYTLLVRINPKRPLLQFNWSRLIQGLMPEHPITDDFNFVVVNMNYFKIFAEKITSVDNRRV